MSVYILEYITVTVHFHLCLHLNLNLPRFCLISIGWGVCVMWAVGTLLGVPIVYKLIFQGYHQNCQVYWYYWWILSLCVVLEWCAGMVDWAVRVGIIDCL